MPTPLPGPIAAQTGHTWRGRAWLAIAAVGAAIAAAGCGGNPCGGPCGQGAAANEPHGNYPVAVLQATFPADQHIAKRSTMQIVVRNAGSKKIPSVSVTLKCSGAPAGGFATAADQADLADPQRPQFVVDKVPTLNPSRPPIDPAPAERTSGYVDTYPLGVLSPGQTRAFRWDVAAVRAGPFRICWRVNAGLIGAAVATRSNDSPLPVAGEFAGNISNVAPQAHIAADGTAVVSR